jgi:hypothetical protein
MRKKLQSLLLGALLVLLTPIGSRPEGSSPKNAGSVAPCVVDYAARSGREVELVQVEIEWCDAAIHRDAARLERIFADDIAWLEDVGYRNKKEVMNRYMAEVQEPGVEIYRCADSSHWGRRSRVVTHAREENDRG